MEIKRQCTNCGHELVEAKMKIGSNSMLLYKISDGLKGFFTNYSKVNVHVCNKCGHVELFAEKIDIFK